MTGDDFEDVLRGASRDDEAGEVDDRRRPGLRFALLAGTSLLAATGLAVGTAVAVFPRSSDVTTTGPTTTPAPAAISSPATNAVPKSARDVVTLHPTAEHPRVDAEWLAVRAEATGMPERALLAYASAVLDTDAIAPGCHLGWTTLAAIGSIESHHGTITGGTIDATGRAVPEIVGPPLSGGEHSVVRDTDGGKLDGDTEWDRAVGPMQFLPSTWGEWGRDGDGDGIADVHDLDDDAAAAADYLCAGGGDLSVQADWEAAIATYNGHPDYAPDVAAEANRLTATEAAIAD